MFITAFHRRKHHAVTDWLHLWRMVDASGSNVPDSISSMDLTLAGGASIDVGGDGIDIGDNAARMETTCDNADIDLMYPSTDVYTIFLSCYLRGKGSDTLYGYPISVGDDPTKPVNGFFSTFTNRTIWDYTATANNRVNLILSNLGDGVDVQFDLALVKTDDKDTNVIYGYIDGVYAGTTVAEYLTTPFGVAASPFILGNLQNYNRGMDAIYNWAGIYNGALSQSEATAIVEAGRPA